MTRYNPYLVLPTNPEVQTPLEGFASLGSNADGVPLVKRDSGLDSLVSEPTPCWPWTMMVGTHLMEAAVASTNPIPLPPTQISSPNIYSQVAGFRVNSGTIAPATNLAKTMGVWSIQSSTTAWSGGAIAMGSRLKVDGGFRFVCEGQFFYNSGNAEHVIGLVDSNDFWSISNGYYFYWSDYSGSGRIYAACQNSEGTTSDPLIGNLAFDLTGDNRARFEIVVSADRSQVVFSLYNYDAEGSLWATVTVSTASSIPSDQTELVPMVLSLSKGTTADYLAYVDYFGVGHTDGHNRTFSVR